MKALPALRSPADRNALVEANLALVGWVVGRHFPELNRAGRCPAGTLDDALQEGRLGLLRAAERWDEGRGVAFSTYAVKAIWSRVNDWVNGGGVVKVPRHAKRGESAAVGAARERAGRTASLDAYTEACGESLAGTDDPSAAAERSEAVERVKDAVAGLPARERRVIAGGYFLEETLAGTGARIGVSKERVRQLRLRALKKLRAALGGRP